MADNIADLLNEVGILTKLVKSLKSSNKDLKEIKSSTTGDVKGDVKSKLKSQFKQDEGIIVTGFSNAAIEQLKLISPAVADEKTEPVKAKKSGGLMDGILAVVGVGLGVAGLLGAMSGVDALAGALGTGDNLKSLMQNLAEGLGAFSGPSLLALGGLLGAGALFGVVGGLGTSFKVAVGMTAIGAGLGGFFAGLALGDAGASFLNSDGSSIKALMVNLAEGLGAFSGPSMVALGALLGAGALFGAVGGPAVAGMAAVGMAAIGLGLGGFFAGLALADKGAGMLNSDGSSIKALMVNLAEGLGAFSGPSMVALGALLGAGALFGAVGGPAVAGMAAVGMAAIGLGLGGFFAGLAVADKGIDLMTGDGEPGESIKMLMVNMGAGLGGLFDGVKDLTLEDIAKLPLAAAAASSSMIAIAGANGIAAILGGLTKIVNFFSGGTNPMEFVMEIGEKAGEVDAGAKAIERVAEALKRLSGLDISIKSNFKDFAEDLKKSIPIFEAAINGDSGGFFGKNVKGLMSEDVDYEGAAQRIKTLRESIDGDINASIKLDVSTKIADLNESMSSLIGESNRLLVENNTLLGLILQKEPSVQQVPGSQPGNQQGQGNQVTNFDQSGDPFRQMQAI
jgi:hypothetical protein